MADAFREREREGDGDTGRGCSLSEFRQRVMYVKDFLPTEHYHSSLVHYLLIRSYLRVNMHARTKFQLLIIYVSHPILFLPPTPSPTYSSGIYKYFEVKFVDGGFNSLGFL